MKLYHSGQSVYTTEDVSWLRRSIKIGDKIRCKVMVKDIRKGRIFSETRIRATVARKYPHIVEAVTDDGRRLTVSYVDMITDHAILYAAMRDRLDRVR